MSSKLTVLIPCKDERHNLENCIASVREVADEILVADSGSADGTIELARSLGARVIEREYVHAGDFKNWAIPQAEHPWVFVIDADERVDAALAAEIRSHVDRDTALDGFWVYRRNYFLGRPVRYSGWSSDKVLRLFRRDVGRYVGDSDHAEIELPDSRVARLEHRMDHFTYWSIDDYFRKFHRYTRQRAELRHARGKRPSYFKMLLTVPVRFFHLYVIRWGFLDGYAGLQVCMFTALSSFTKQAILWELELDVDQQLASTTEPLKQRAA